MFIAIAYAVVTMKLTQSIKQTPRWATLVRQARNRLKLSQEDFGKLFGVSQASVSDWERGINEPSGDVTWYLYQQATKKK